MSRYIDADALSDKLLVDGFYSGLNNALNSSPNKRKFTIGEIRSMLQKAPAADVAPITHGHWKDAQWNFRGDSLDACSVCGREVVNCAFRYCPNCGARMDGER